MYCFKKALCLESRPPSYPHHPEQSRCPGAQKEQWRFPKVEGGYLLGVLMIRESYYFRRLSVKNWGGGGGGIWGFRTWGVSLFGASSNKDSAILVYIKGPPSCLEITQNDLAELSRCKQQHRMGLIVAPIEPLSAS